MLLVLPLTVSGIYGLLAQSVAQRTHGLAVRDTLGAGRGDLLRLVTRDALVLTAAGASLGIALAWALDQALTAFLFGVPGEEPIALAASGLLMMVVTLLACLAPYRRALRIDPGRTRRYEQNRADHHQVGHRNAWQVTTDVRKLLEDWLPGF